jgi:response regulator NasT
MDSEKRQTLLLIDDDSLVLATFAKGLKELGYEVLLAGDGRKGLQLAASEPPPDLAIIDMRMPEMSGIETARGLKQLGVPTMFFSAYDDEESVEQAVAEGAMGYLLKPIDVEKAVPTIKAALKRAQDLRESRDAERRLGGALETSNVVNVVVGILMERHRIGRQEAFDLLRNRARSERRKVKEVAEEFLDYWERFNRLQTGKRADQS